MVMPDEAPFASAAACCLYKTQCAMARKPDIPDAHWPGMPQSSPRCIQGCATPHSPASVPDRGAACRARLLATRARHASPLPDGTALTHLKAEPANWGNLWGKRWQDGHGATSHWRQAASAGKLTWPLRWVSRSIQREVDGLIRRVRREMR